MNNWLFLTNNILGGISFLLAVGLKQAIAGRVYRQCKHHLHRLMTVGGPQTRFLLAMSVEPQYGYIVQ